MLWKETLFDETCQIFAYHMSEYTINFLNKVDERVVRLLEQTIRFVSLGLTTISTNDA